MNPYGAEISKKFVSLGSILNITQYNDMKSE